MIPVGDEVMRAVQYDNYGAPTVLQVRSLAVPKVRPGHVLVRVAASSINALDVIIRSGEFRWLSGRKFPRGTGFDFAGHIAAVGGDVGDFEVGQPVWGYLDGMRQGPSGAAADYVLAPLQAIASAPRGIDLTSASALPGAGGSALVALTKAAELRAGQRILIRGASGGVGTAAVQLAHSMGAQVVALARTTHHSALHELGAQAAIDYRSVNPDSLGRFEVVLDTVGLGMRPWRRLLAPGGRYINLTIGRLADLGYMASSLALGSKRIRFVQAAPDGNALEELARRVDEGTLRPVIATSHPLSDIVIAHQAVEHRGALGKQIVTINSACRDSNQAV